MEAEEIFELLDSYWFEHEVFTKKPASFPHKTNPVVEIKKEVQEPKVSSSPSLHVRSLSNHALMMMMMMSCKSSTTSFSSTPKLQTILSGKEIITDEFASETVDHHQQQENKLEMDVILKPKKSSKSLSDLEFEELKGFMDLGFVFSEEDKDSSLVSIIPGLQRLKGNSTTEEAFVNNNNKKKKAVVSRPYLSEAWDVLDQRKVENSLMNLRIPSQLGNEVNMKDHLRFWAHTVASTVR